MSRETPQDRPRQAGSRGGTGADPGSTTSDREGNKPLSKAVCGLTPARCRSSEGVHETMLLLAGGCGGAVTMGRRSVLAHAHTGSGKGHRQRQC